MTDEAQAREGLEPCPFCGGVKARVICIRDGYKVACPCGACGKPEFHGPLDRPPSNQRAIAAWNRRATPTPLAPSADLEARARGILFDVASTNTFAPTDIPEREAILSERTALRAMLALAAEVRAEGGTDPVRMAYKTGYNEGYIDATDDGTGTGYADHDAAEEGWQQYLEQLAAAPPPPEPIRGAA